MLHNLPLVTTIATGLALALVLGFLAARLKLPAVVGYLVAGVVIGPYTPGIVADTAAAKELAEIGVMLLMFGVGLHFSIEDLMEVRKISLPGAILQIAVASALGFGAATLWGWSVGAAVVFGISLSVASTVVVLRALEGGGTLESMDGKIALGWLIVEDLAMVLVLVLLPVLSGELGGNPSSGGSTSLPVSLGITIVKVGVFVALMLVVGRRVFPKILRLVARTGSRELFTLCVIAAAVSIAYGATAIFGVSFALGAFFAGMVLRESEFSHRAAEESLPLRDAFAVLFFVSVGMLFDPAVIVDHPFELLAVLAIIIIGKALAAAGLVLMFRYPLRTALTVAASLAQIGEFSFILADLGLSLGLLTHEGESLIVAGALVSIGVNPMVFASLGPVQKWISKWAKLARFLEPPSDPLAVLPSATEQTIPSGLVVLVGFGRVGRRIGQTLSERGVPYVVAEQNREIVERLRAKGIAAISGDASDPEVLEQAHIEEAGMLVVATPDTFDIRKIIEIARRANPGIETVVRTHDEEEADLLKEETAERIFLGEEELAKGMIRHVLDRYGKGD